MTTSITLRVMFQPNLSILNLGKWREKLERKLFDIFDCTAKSLINQGLSERRFQCDLWFSSADPSATWVHLRITGLLYTPWGGFVNHKCGIIRVYLLIIKKSIDNGGGLCYTFPQIEAHRVNSTPPVARLGGRRDRGGKGPVPKWLPWRAVGWQCGEYPLCCRSNAEGYPP